MVAAPTYPILSGSPAGPSDFVDWGEKFPDTWFVTTSILDLSVSGDATLGGMIDPQRIAVAGHSDGALISFGDGFEAWRYDWRVRAVISYAAKLDEPGAIYQANGRAFLHFASDQDEYNDFGSTIAWDHENLQPPSWTVALWNAGHSRSLHRPVRSAFRLCGAHHDRFPGPGAEGSVDVVVLPRRRHPAGSRRVPVASRNHIGRPVHRGIGPWMQ